MSEHPIEGLMRTAMNSIQDMVDVNTIIGEPIETGSDIMIVPISKVCFAFAAGGSEFNTETLNEYKKKEKEEEMQYKLPFGGGSGAAVSINPVAFLVINNENIKLMPINHASSIDKLIDYIPDVINKFCKKEDCEVNKEENGAKIQAELKTEVRKEPEASRVTEEQKMADYLEDE